MSKSSKEAENPSKKLNSMKDMAGLNLTLIRGTRISGSHGPFDIYYFHLDTHKIDEIYLPNKDFYSHLKNDVKLIISKIWKYMFKIYDVKV